MQEHHLNMKNFQKLNFNFAEEKSLSTLLGYPEVEWSHCKTIFINDVLVSSAFLPALMWPHASQGYISSLVQRKFSVLI